MNEEMQMLADKLGFDLKKLPYGYKFRIGKLVLNYYDTTGTVVISKPKSEPKVKKMFQNRNLNPCLKS